jgi:hypothetical protein
MTAGRLTLLATLFWTLISVFAVPGAGANANAAAGPLINIAVAAFAEGTVKGRPTGMAVHVKYTVNPDVNILTRLDLLPSKKFVNLNPEAGREARAGETVDFWFRLTRFPPPPLLPRAYTFRFTTFGLDQARQYTGQQETQERAVVFRPPPEGVLAKTWISRTKSGRPVASSCTPDRTRKYVRCVDHYAYGALSGRQPRIWAHFRFAAVPTRGPVVIAWYAPNRRLLGTLQKPLAKRIDTFVAVNTASLATGVWTCVLTVRAIELKAIKVAISK